MRMWYLGSQVKKKYQGRGSDWFYQILLVDELRWEVITEVSTSSFGRVVRGKV